MTAISNGTSNSTGASAVGSAVVGLSGPSGHHVGVDVDRVDRVRHRDAAVGAEDLLDVAGVLLAAVRDEDLAGLRRGQRQLMETETGFFARLLHRLFVIGGAVLTRVDVEEGRREARAAENDLVAASAP